METKLKNVMASIFGVDVSYIAENASPDNIENWDSLRHMNLIVALEEEFSVRFDEEEMVEMLNYRLILLKLKEKTG